MNDPLHDDELHLRTPVIMRWLLVALAVASLLMAIVGLFLPVLPTVPFILLAAWAAARSSPRLSRWMEEHPHMGPHIVAWRRGGVVPRRAKWMATLMMAGSSVGMLLVLGAKWFVLVAIATMATVAAWLWQRPEVLPDRGRP